jgi:hypothetical protein
MNDLEALERAGWDALCAGTGGQFYGSLMTPDAVMVLAHGAVLDRDQVVASLDEAPPWTAYRLSDARAVTLGPDAAALVYRGEASRPGQDFAALMTSCYVRRDGDWRLAVYQQTPIP